ncbi:hypothetical protein NB521_00515 [Vibrio alginolyticus]|nr:hypothetical protein [Vibrio alginolyticus]
MITAVCGGIGVALLTP